MKTRLLALLLPFSSVLAEPLSGPVLDRYEQLLLRTPEPGTAFDKIYQHYLETEGLDALAKKWAEAAAKGQPDQADYLMLAGLLSDRRGKADDALKLLQEANKLSPGWRTASALATVEVRAGKLQDAVKSYQQAIAATPPADVAPKLYRGLALSQQRLMDSAGAVETWQAYAKATPGDPFVQEEAGDALLEAGRFNEAFEVFSALRDLKDIDPARKLSATLKLAEVEKGRGNKEEALKIYTASLAESGDASWLQRDVRIRIERMFRADDDLPGLVKYYRERIKVEPSDLEAVLRLSDALVELSQKEEALKVLQAASEKAPDNKEVQLKYVQALMVAERPADAEKVLDDLVKKNPRDMAVIERLGEAQWQSYKLGKGTKETAIATWRRLAPDTADAGAVQRVAEIFRNHDLKDETVVEYRRALALDPSANDRRERLAEYLVQIERRDEAFKELDGMIAASGESGETYLRLARIQRRFGDSAAALKSLEAAGKFPDRAFERGYLAWQIAAEEKNWEKADALAASLRSSAQTDPEVERADECTIEAWRELRRSDQEIARLLERQKAGSLNERDYRLLFLLAVNADDNGSAEYALTEGLKAFPQSALLARLDVAYARRIADAGRRIAALERLEKLEPQRAGDWMIERVRAYRDDQKWNQAVDLARQCVQLSPAKPEMHILLADTLQAADRGSEAVAALQEAVRLSDNPNQVRLRLADLFLAQGQTAEARAVLDEAFEAEEQPSGKLQLTGRLAGVYIQDGKIDDLIAKFRDRQKAEQGGWRYALYLAEVYTMMQDSVRSMEELDKALAGKPDDPMLLKKLQALSETNGDTDAGLKYARKIAEVEPSKENRAKLGEALARDGKLDEALALIKDNSDEFLETPDTWEETVRMLQGDDKAGELATLLEGKLRANPADWRSRAALAEILMGAGQTDAAAALLWEMLAMKEEVSANASPSPTPQSATQALPTPVFSRRGMVYMGGSYSPSQSRQMRFSEKYQQAIQILSANYENSPRYSRARFRGVMMMPTASGSTTLADTQDEAIAYLASMALRDAREEEFLARLKEALKDRTLEDRLTIYGMMQAPEPTLDLVAQVADSADASDTTVTLAQQMLQGIVANRQNNRFQVGSYTDDQLKDLMSKLNERVAKLAKPQNALQQYHLLVSVGSKDEAEKLVDKTLAEVDVADPMQLSVAMSFAIMRRDFDRAVEFRSKLRALKGSSRNFAGADYGLAMQMMMSDSHREKGIDLLADEFLSPSGGMTIYGMGGMGRQQLTWNQLRGNLAQQIPFPTKALNQQQVGMLRGFSQQNPQFAKALPDIIKRFSARGQETKSASLQQAAIWLMWFSGQKKEAEAALSALVKEQADEDLLVNLAVIQADDKKNPEALKTLDQVRSRSGPTFELAARLRLVLALQGNDKEASRQAALKLSGMRLVDYEQQELIQEMKRLGLESEASQLEKKRVVSRNPGQRSQQMIQVMQNRMEAGDRAEALALAYAILSKDPLSRTVRNESYQQQQALRALEKFGELEGYITKLKSQLEAAPQSARLNLQLAQALQIKEPKNAEPYYRKLTELRPNDAEWLQQLGMLLVNSNQDEEAMRLYDRVLEKNPMQLFAQGTNFIEPYRKTRNWKRLVDAIAKSPDPKPDPLNPNRQNFSNVFLEIGKQVQRAKPPVDPTDIWLKGLKWDESGAVQTRPLLAQTLLRAGRDEEARQVIEEAFFPPGRDQATARVFVYNRQFRPNTIWNQTSMYGSGEIESPAIRMMKTAQTMGFLKDIIPRLEKLPASSDGSNPLLMARIVARDEKVLEDLRQLVAKAKEAKPGTAMPTGINHMTFRLLAAEMADWPAAKDLPDQMLDAAALLAQNFGNDFHSRMAIQLQRANLAIERGRNEVAQKALKDWQKARIDWQRQGAQIDINQGVRVMKMMVLAGMTEEAAALKEAIKADPNYTRNSYQRRILAQAENELKILQGTGGDVAAVLAWAPGSEQGSLVWDMKPLGGEEEDNRTVWLSDQPFAKMSGVYTLDVYFGDNEHSMKKLFSKPSAQARGTWTGKLPAQRGFLRAVLRKGDEMRLGPTVPVATGKSLLPADSVKSILETKNGVAQGWSSVPPIPISQEKGGPAGTGFLRLDGDRNSEFELVGERIAIDPKKNYLTGAWFRPTQDGNAQLRWRTYDSSGKEVNNYSANGNFRADRWNYGVQSFGRRSSYSFSDNVAWLEPYIQFRGRCDLQGLFVTEIEAAPEEND